jgi:tetratricopeptide (TPR) repeat protein
MLDDGTPPPDSVRIERVCASRVIPEQMTDRKGRFSLQLGQDTSMLLDASDSGSGTRNGSLGGGSGSGSPLGGVRERDLMNCELRASLAGYRSETVSLANHKSMDNPDVGTIILHRMSNVEGLTISATSLNAPKDAKKAFDKGHEALGKNKLEDARKNLEKAVGIYPKYAAAWYDLGIVEDREKNTEGARKAFGESLAADPKYMNPYEGLADIVARERKWQDVADITDKMIHLNPVDFPRAYFLNAVANLNLNRLDPAEKSATELARMDTHHQIPRVEHVLSVILLNKRDYSEAAVHLRKYIEISEPGPDVDAARKQLENIEKALAARDQHQ